MESSKTPKIYHNSKVAKHESTEFGLKQDLACSTSLQSPLQCKDVKVSLKKSAVIKVLATKREKELKNEREGNDGHLPPNHSKTSKEFKIKDTKTKKQNDLEMKAVSTSEKKGNVALQVNIHYLFSIYFPLLFSY